MASIGTILEQIFAHDIYKRVSEWTQNVPLFLVPTCQVRRAAVGLSKAAMLQVMLLRIYEGLVTRNHSQTHCLLVHKPILLPLLEVRRGVARLAAVIGVFSCSNFANERPRSAVSSARASTNTLSSSFIRQAAAAAINAFVASTRLALSDLRQNIA